MKPFVFAATSAAVVAVAASTGYHGARRLEAAHASGRTTESLITLHNAPLHTAIPADELTKVVKKTCTACHNDGLLIGGVSLDSFSVADAAKHPRLAEKMIT